MILSHLNRYLRPAHTYYVDATAGSDSNPGNAEHSALQTIAAVNALALKPGDRVLFKRGETWTGTITVPSGGAPGRYITMDAYGDGAAPILNGDTSAAIQATAVNRGYWRIRNLDIRCTGDVASGSRGIFHRAGPSWVDDVPGWFIEYCTFNCGILIRSSNVIVAHNTFDGTGNSEAKNALWITLPISVAPLVEWNTFSNYLGRGIWVEGCGGNPVVRHNTVHDIADLVGLQYSAGIDIDGWDTPMGGAVVEYNRVYNSDFGIQLENCFGEPICRSNIISGTDREGIQIICYGAHDSAPEMRGVDVGGKLYNNLVYDCRAGLNVYYSAGYDAFHNTFSNNDVGADGAVLMQYDSGQSAQVAGWVWKNNVVDWAGGDIWSAEDIDIFETQDNNVYSSSGGSFAIVSPWSTRNFAQYQIDTAQEANSVAADPVFVNEATDDYHLQVTSPCIGAGDATAGVTKDLDGVVRGAAVDIGAYEYVA